jgi:hypothetical protein
MARASTIGREKEFAMASTALYEQEIVEDDIAPSISLGATASRTPFSWSAAIAGVFIAIAVSLIIIALGAGIGLSFASPYGGPSGTTLTLASAIWLVMAQSMGFATGGYVAARLRSPAHDGVVGETTFRDGAQGLVVWALGVVILAAVTGWLTILGARFGANLATAGTVAASANSNESANGAVDYFVDLMFRPAATTSGQAGGAAGTANRQPLDPQARTETVRIVERAVGQGKLEDNDRDYLAQLVMMRTGLSADEAQQRVTMVENAARESIKAAADKAATAGAYVLFWMFMALLFGSVAATLAGILGGELRDAEGRGAAASPSLAAS